MNIPLTSTLVLSFAFGMGYHARSDTPMPQIKGKLVYQVDKRDLNSQNKSDFVYYGETLRLYDFATNGPLLNLNETYNWPIKHTINAHFSPDGRFLVFTGVVDGNPLGWSSCDIFIWPIGSHDLPVNLTAGNGVPDEDAIFTSNSEILYKSNGHLSRMNSDGSNKRRLTLSDDPLIDDIERSGPNITPDGKTIVFWEKAQEQAGIYRCKANGTERTKLIDVDNTQEYYPAHFKGNLFFYVQWNEQHQDQVYAVDVLRPSVPIALPFNAANYENSDPTRVNDQYAIISSTRQGIDGQDHDLFLVDTQNGATWSLSSLGLNNSYDKELGASYSATITPPPAPVGIVATGQIISSVPDVSFTNSVAIPLANSQVRLEQTGKSPQLTTSDSQGRFSFSNLNPGSYTVKVVTVDKDGSGSEVATPVPFTLSQSLKIAKPKKAATSTQITVPTFKLYSVWGQVNSKSANKKDPTRTAIAGATVQLSKTTSAGYPAFTSSTVTDANGFYLFSFLGKARFKLLTQKAQSEIVFPKSGTSVSLPYSNRPTTPSRRIDITGTTPTPPKASKSSINGA